MKIMREVGVGLEKGSIKKIQEGMTEVAVVDLDQVQEPVLTGMELDVINVENMITSLKTG